MSEFDEFLKSKYEENYSNLKNEILRVIEECDKRDARSLNSLILAENVMMIGAKEYINYSNTNCWYMNKELVHIDRACETLIKEFENSKI